MVEPQLPNTHIEETGPDITVIPIHGNGDILESCHYSIEQSISSYPGRYAITGFAYGVHASESQLRNARKFGNSPTVLITGANASQGLDF